MGFELAGKRRGIVVDNADPLKQGRLKVRVLEAYGLQPVAAIPWALPCFPAGGSSDCGFFSLPEKGACVWVEFLWQNGEPDPSCPVWCGVWCPNGCTPSEVAGPAEDAHYYTVLKSANGKHSITLCDKPGGEFVEIVHGKQKQIVRFDANGDAFITTPNGILYLN